jgi:hypothetical protein
MTTKDEEAIFMKYKWTARQINLSMEEADSTDVAKDINEDLKFAIHEATLSAKQEQLEEDIRKIKKLFADNKKDEPYETTLEEILHTLKQSKANSD